MSIAKLRIAFVKPSLGEQRGRPYRTPAVLEPVVAALVAGQTPEDIELHFHDERLAEIDFHQKYDLVAISVETFTALRSYQIAGQFRRAGNRVLLGGFHPSLVPEEAADYADSVAIGTVEGIWPKVIEDLRQGNLAKVYSGSELGFGSLKLDRSIFAGKKYLPVSLIESSRGCRFNCNFCSVHSFYGNSLCFRPVNEVAEEIAAIRSKFVFFTDDNIVSAPDQSRRLFSAIKPLKIKWASQASITSAADPEFLDAMADSGCFAVIIGLESIRHANLEKMGKKWAPGPDKLKKMLNEFRQRGIMVYGTFVFGYPGDTPQLVDETVEFALDQKLFMANFNMLYPFPGTEIYRQLDASNRLIDRRWWLSRSTCWDFPVFIPDSMTPEQLSYSIKAARRKFSRISALFKRGLDFDANCRNPFNSMIFLATNIVSRLDISRKSGLVPGFGQNLENVK